ncbi:MAG: non-canonical purine NTP pyrophosphatase [Proteobacteria bacterium]|nr:non-canonical purine NTP pyrophosphatase [Pseudomonadota bacterium]
MMKFILASQNAHKAQEFASAITTHTIEPAPHGIDVDENETSFLGNARLKARAYANAFQCNALADDSGLCVDALNGDPGIHSQRFAIMPPDIDDDPDRTAANNRKLLRLLNDVPKDKRTAHFTCALCLVIVQPKDIKEIVELASASHNHTLFSFFDKNNHEVDACSKEIARAEIALEAHAPGRILTECHGKAGFGYDPLFYCPETQCTFAELTQQQKLAVSHRGRAIKALKTVLSSSTP